MRNSQNDVLKGCLCAVGCETLYGLSYVLTKTATNTASPFALLGWRFLVAVAVMSLCVVLGLVRIDLRGKPAGPLLLVALFNPCIYFLGETLGISRTTASESGVILACIPVVSLLASTVVLRKKPSRRQVAGILVTLAGVVVTVCAVGAASSLSIVGYAFLLTAVVSYALYSVFVEKASEHTAAEVTYVMLVAGAVVFVGLAVFEALTTGDVAGLMALPFRDGAFTVAVLFQGIGCSIAAFFLANMAIARIGVNRASSFIGLATVVSILAGALLLKETFTAHQAVGACVIVMGVYVANTGKRSQRPLPAP
ncbi:DMT family transporter [Propionibacterium australiense]|uniref:DMT family transporter n=1 Tax=Propionibacterium australiense TaxID=119981 RepID=A0A8B3FJR3_9ACTN|nr:DMT family transporter [Propionibacterium australiense]RLP10712.1 DMT family transporter [Propionibacterium australiense]